MPTPQAPPIRSTQVLLAALILGLVVFSGVAAYMRQNSPGQVGPEVTNILQVVVPILFVSSATVFMFLRRRFMDQAAAGKNEMLELIRQDRIPFQLHALAIFGAALAEGPGLLGAVTVLLGGSWYLLLAPLLSILTIATLIPTQSRLEETVRGLSG